MSRRKSLTVRAAEQFTDRPHYLVDTHFYIEALRSPKDSRGAPTGFGAVFRAWHRARLGQLGMSTVVVHELLAGAGDAAYRQRIMTEFIAPFQARGRLLVPSLWAWERAATADALLRRDPQHRAVLEHRGFRNDLLLALTARETGATVITPNEEHFAVLQRVMGVRYRVRLPGLDEV